MQIPWKENIWFSPHYVIDQLSKTNLNDDRIKIKKAREAWVCAMAMTCHAKERPAEWWIQVPKNDPPDILAMNVIPNKNGISQDMAELYMEVFEISDHDKESTDTSIMKKLEDKDYSGFTLIGFVRRNEIFDHALLTERIKQFRPKILSLLLLVGEKEFPIYSLIQIYPSNFKVECNVRDYLANP